MNRDKDRDTYPEVQAVEAALRLRWRGQALSLRSLRPNLVSLSFRSTKDLAQPLEVNLEVIPEPLQTAAWSIHNLELKHRRLTV